MRRKATEWLRENGALSVTVAGVSLYVALRLPAAIFYSRLGVNPEIAGITYINLLAGSTLGVVVMVLAIAVLFYLALSVLSLAVLYVKLLPLAAVMLFKNSRAKTRNMSNDERFDLAHSTFIVLWKAASGAFDRFGLTVDRVGVLMRRYRSLMELGVRALDEQVEADVIRRRLAKAVALPNVARIPLHIVSRWVGRRRVSVAISLFAVAAFLVLPMLSFLWVNEVRQGRQDLGSRYALFAYAAHPVQVDVASKEAPQGLQMWVGKELFLIGQNAQQVVLYSPKENKTVLLPLQAVQIFSR
ncbi:hypothetical protein [Nocardia sp. NRRL S-836]|uniref:hypothetical protein n=1 Tax=Nocardia sp. NRRL S-836 TaxID=1519492 RepID=UPI000ACAE484|nr:hypothetical protein [Nocardia sp. NRRL S-836]